MAQTHYVSCGWDGCPNKHGHDPKRDSTTLQAHRKKAAKSSPTAAITVQSLQTEIRTTRPVDQLATTKAQEADLVRDLLDKRTLTKRVDSHGRKVVAIDIDGVLADFNAAMKPFSKVKDTDENTPDDYNYVTSGWYDTWEEFEHAHVTVMDDAGSIPPQEPTGVAGEAIRKLKDAGLEVKVITARREQWRGATLEFFSRHDIPIETQDLHFMDKKNKSEMHFDYLVDDAPKNVIDALQNSSAEAVIYNQRYNEHLPGNRVHNLMDFANFVLEREASLM